MNKYLYNKIMLSVAKVVKKSINEAYDNKSIYNKDMSFDELSILNSVGNIGDILQVNQFDEYRVIPDDTINESIFDGFSKSDEPLKWKDLAVCFGEGLWVYLDWVGLNREIIWARENTKLYKDNIPDKNGYENTQYILNNYKNCIKGTIWEKVQNCEYPIYIPDKNQLKRIYNVNKKYKLMRLHTHFYWSSCQRTADLSKALYVYFFRDGGWDIGYKNVPNHSIALLHF